MGPLPGRAPGPRSRWPLPQRPPARPVHPRRSIRMRLANARLIDGTGAPPLPDATLVFGERIEAIGLGPPADPPDLDVAGRTVLPGLINAHIHLTFDPTNPDALNAARA